MKNSLTIGIIALVAVSSLVGGYGIGSFTTSTEVVVREVEVVKEVEVPVEVEVIKEGLQAQISQLQLSLNDLQSQLDVKELDLDSALEELEGAKEEIVTLDDEISNLLQEKTELENQIILFPNQIEDLNEQLNDRNSQISNLEEELASKIEENQNLQSQIQGLQADVDALQGRIEELQPGEPPPPPVRGALVNVEIEPNHSAYLGPLLFGFYTVVGLVVNNGESSVTDIEVTGRFFDSNGELMAFESTTITRGFFFPMSVPPSYKVPFKIEVSDSDLSELIASYSLSVTASIAGDKPKGLTVETANVVMADHNELFNYRTWKVVGILTNEGTVDAEDTFVFAALHDSTGKVVGVAGFSIFDTQPGDIAVGRDQGFSLETILPEGITVSSVTIFAESDSLVLTQQ